MWLGVYKDIRACETIKTKTEHKLINCKFNFDQLKSNSVEKINNLKGRLELAQDNINLLESEHNEYASNEQTIRNLNGNLEQCQQEKEYLQGNLTAKQLEVVMLSSNYSVCLNKLETCTGQVNTCKANL